MNCTNENMIPLLLTVDNSSDEKNVPLLSPKMFTQTSVFSVKTTGKEKLRQKVPTLQLNVTNLNKKLDLSETSSFVVQYATVEDFKQLCDKFLPSKCAEFVKLQADLHSKKPH